MLLSLLGGWLLTCAVEVVRWLRQSHDLVDEAFGGCGLVYCYLSPFLSVGVLFFVSTF